MTIGKSEEGVMVAAREQYEARQEWVRLHKIELDEQHEVLNGRGSQADWNAARAECTKVSGRWDRARDALYEATGAWLSKEAHS